MLERYAEVFPALELNVTFYRHLPERAMASLARRTPPRFEFVAKAPGEATHARRLEAMEVFARSLTPLRAAGKLRGVLLQFSTLFRRTAGARSFVEALARPVRDLPVAVELRHSSWARPDTLRWLGDRGLAHVSVEVPRLPWLYPPLVAATGGLGYLRLHTRSAAGWLSPAHRYQYDFTDADLGLAAGKVAALLRVVRKLYVFFNNCGRGDAARNAERLGELLRRRGILVREPDAPAGLFSRNSVTGPRDGAP
jgi:uncharacterized protein YecE (DUF72 family)